MKPTKKNPNAKIVAIHTDTNDLSSNLTPTDIVTNIINLTADVKNNFDQSCDVMVLSIVARGVQLNHRAAKVNKELKELCFSKNTSSVDQTNIHRRKHLSRSKIHFSYHAKTIIFDNICKRLGY